MKKRIWLLSWLAGTAMAQLPPACANFPNNCLYAPTIVRNFTATAASISYRDAAGDLRTLELYVRVPEGSGLRPAVIWSPEASATVVAAKDNLAAWSETTARAGYVSVAVTHPWRTPAQSEALCRALKLDEAECIAMKPHNWDWPNDLREVVSWLIRQSGVDTERIAVAGHADGGSAALSLAGATRLLASTKREAPNTFADPRPVAFISLSPTGPTVNGFYDADWLEPDHSWKPVRRPALLATGAGDNTCQNQAACQHGDTPARRRIPFELLPAGGKYQLFLKTVKLSHEFLGTLDTAACAEAGGDAALCARLDVWLRASVLAFLDGHVRGTPAAQTWLKEGLAVAASAGVAQWEVK